MTDETAQAIEIEIAKETKQTRASAALGRFLSEMDLGSPVFDDDYSLRLSEMRALLEPRDKVGFKRLTEDAVIPTKAHPSDSGFDLVASEDTTIEPGETVVVPTGIAVQLPSGYEATVRPRSGVTSKTKLRVAIGTVDNQYRGEVGVIVDNINPRSVEDVSGYLRLDSSTYWNHRVTYEKGTYKIRKGERIAQLVITRLPDVEAVEVFDVDETVRGSRGFGSSGVSS